MTIRVLVVDDSEVMRSLIVRKIQAENDLEVVGTANNAQEARALMKSLNPDVVTLDVEMPGMDGISFLRRIMELRPTPVIVLSEASGPGAQTTIEAMKYGAVSCYSKSTRYRSLADDDKGQLAKQIREAARITMPAPKGSNHSDAQANRVVTKATGDPPGLIAIGSSTGGVEALHKLLAGFPADCPPTVIVQHINASFDEPIARSLDKIAKPKVDLAKPDQPLKRGHIWLAPGGEKHLLIRPAGSHGYRTVLRSGAPVSGHRPSVDKLFSSVADAVGSDAIGIVLTGMGQDGALGMLAMAKAGAETIAQDEASCVVFGMPRAAIACGAARDVLPLRKIASHVFDRRQRAAA